MPTVVGKLIESAENDLAEDPENIESVLLITIRKGGNIGLTVGPNLQAGMRLAFLVDLLVKDLVADELTQDPVE